MNWLATSPDGQQLAINEEGKTRIFSRDSAEHRDLAEADSGTVLAWRPDGGNSAFTASEQPEKSEVWTMENFLPKEK